MMVVVHDHYGDTKVVTMPTPKLGLHAEHGPGAGLAPSPFFVFLLLWSVDIVVIILRFMDPKEGVSIMTRSSRVHAKLTSYCRPYSFPWPRPCGKI